MVTAPEQSARRAGLVYVSDDEPGLRRVRRGAGFAYRTPDGAPVSAELSGEPRCEGPALLLPLAAGTGRERVDVRLFADGRYRADIVVGAGGITAPIRLQGTF